jgi:NTE family protein
MDPVPDADGLNHNDRPMPAEPSSSNRPVPALVLTGGGARSAYQAGVLKAIAELLPEQPNPFRVIVGTSAGAVAASVLAARAEHWRQAIAAIEQVWANFHVDHIFHVGRRKMLRSGLHWALSLLSGGLLLSPPRSLFDNEPLRQLLEREVPWRGVGRSIRTGRLDALALCCTGYGTARSVAFFQARRDLSEWSRHHHVGRRTRLGLPHLMGSLAVPLLFPAEEIEGEWFGDGAMRQMSPLSPAVRLGADRLLIIGMRPPGTGGMTRRRSTPHAEPTPGQIAGFALDNLFTDQIWADLEQIERVNRTLRVAPQVFPHARLIEQVVLVSPSEDVRAIAERCMHTLPPSLKALLRVVGARDARGAQLASYLMFESEYTRALIDLGYRDGLAKAPELRQLLMPDADAGAPASDQEQRSQAQ